jgi:hypothetical protein
MATRLEEAGSLNFFKTFFLIAALYDLILGAVFFVLYGPIFSFLDIALPYSTSYIHLTAGFVFVQGMGYWFVYRNMLRNVDIVRLGVIYKGVYSVVAFYYLLIGQLPDAVFAWFAVLDVLFLIGFVRFLMLARPMEIEPQPAA